MSICTHTNMGTHLCTPTHTIQIYTCTQKHAFCPFIYLVDMFLACLSSVGKNNLLNYPVAQMCLKPTLGRGYQEAI